MVKFAHNSYFQLGVFMSSAMAVQTIGWNQSTHALAVNNSPTQQLPEETDGFNSVQPNQNPPLFSPAFNLLALSFDSPPLNLFSGKSDKVYNSNNFLPISIVPRSQSKPTNSVAHNQQQYLADAKSVSVVAKASSPSLIYHVKQGDTVTKIASEYQIPSQELIKLNQIQDSNLIFVDQRLRIPATAAQNSTSNTNGTAIAQSTQRAIANINTNEANSANEDPYITNLRAEIDQLRDQYRQEQEQGQKADTNNFSTPNTSPAEIVPSDKEDPYITNLRAEIDQLRAKYRHEQAKKQGQTNNPNPLGLVSFTDQPTEQRVKTNTRAISATPKLNKLGKLNPPRLQSNLQSKSIKQDAIALRLPPLSNSEEYLPNIFDGYAWPADGVLTSGYGLRWGRMHQGIDIAAPIGTPVLAAASGVVVGAGYHNGYGNLVKLEHLDGSITLYAHNNRILVTHGQEVEQGEQIAEMGSTGNSTGSHVHFEIHLRDQEIVDPLTLLTAR
jgi:murein DD-endopeptidase MepM/ murein hydrolase activator NlpD